MRDIIFVYRKSLMRLGSTIMRGFHLMEQLKASMGDEFSFRRSRMPRPDRFFLQEAWTWAQKPGSIFIFTKGAARTITDENLYRLSRKAAGICFDWVDAELSKIRLDIPSIHICSSFSQQAEIERIIRQSNSPGQAMVLLHNVDKRLHMLSLQRKRLESLRPVYFGTTKVAYWTRKIEKHIPVIDASSSRKMEANYHKLINFNFHYGVRNPSIASNRISPFTKGFTAAVMGSNILVDRNVPDALRVLGGDYPFLIDEVSEEKIMDTLDFARNSYGGKVWREGLSRMEEVRYLVSPESLAMQFKDILRELGEAV